MTRKQFMKQHLLQSLSASLLWRAKPPGLRVTSVAHRCGPWHLVKTAASARPHPAPPARALPRAVSRAPLSLRHSPWHRPGVSCPESCSGSIQAVLWDVSAQLHCPPRAASSHWSSALHICTRALCWEQVPETLQTPPSLRKYPKHMLQPSGSTAGPLLSPRPAKTPGN